MAMHIITQSGTEWAAAQDDDVPIAGEYLYLTTSVPGRTVAPPVTAGFFRGEASGQFVWEPPFDELVYIISGTGSATERDVRLPLAPGTLAFFSKGSRVQIEFEGPWSEVFVFIGHPEGVTASAAGGP